MNSRLRSPSRLSPQMAPMYSASRLSPRMAMSSQRPLTLSRSPLAMSPRLMQQSPLSMYRSPVRSLSSQSLPRDEMMEPSSYDSEMMLNGLVSVLGLIAIVVGIFHLVTDPAYKPDMSTDDMDKHKKNRNMWGYVLLGIGIVMFLGLAGKWMNARRQNVAFNSSF